VDSFGNSEESGLERIGRKEIGDGRPLRKL